MSWNFSELLHGIAQTPLAEHTALIHGPLELSYRELNQRCSAIGQNLQCLGLEHGAHIGHMLRNSNVYLETFLGAGMAGMRHVNINYRYQTAELLALCDSLDVRALVYEAEFADHIASMHAMAHCKIIFIEVTDKEPVNDFALPFNKLYDINNASDSKQVLNTSSDDIIILATGGTTGLPKGVQWRQEDLWRNMDISMGLGMAQLNLESHPDSMQAHIENLQKIPVYPRFMPLCPQMHAAGLALSLVMLAQGGTVITVPGQHFDANIALDTLVKHKVALLALIGDAFARPLLDALDVREDKGVLDNLIMLLSTGSSLSEECKRALLSHKADLLIMDTLGSSEAINYAQSTTESGTFSPLPTTKVFNDKDEEVRPGSDDTGILAKGGYIPLGYYNDPESSSATFREIKGVRYVFTGDRARVLEDGLIELLGRDSTCINTGGEKVYTVEVERVLLTHSHIIDALVIGLPHPRFGKMVAAVIQTLNGSTVSTTEVQTFCQKQLADYKVPKQLFVIEDMQRGPNGKADYQLITHFAEQQLANTTQ